MFVSQVVKSGDKSKDVVKMERRLGMDVKMQSFCAYMLQGIDFLGILITSHRIINLSELLIQPVFGKSIT